jgi:ATP-dependent Clp protease ATP-binding subunit ClpC
VLERFTERARKVLTLAQEEASRFNHDHIGTGHLLLGLLGEGDGVAARALSSCGLTIETTRDRLPAIVNEGEEDTTSKQFTPPLKHVLAMALKASQRLGHDYIGTEHLLLGLASEPEGVATRILSDLEIDREGLRAEVMSMIDEEGRLDSGPNF